MKRRFNYISVSIILFFISLLTFTSCDLGSLNKNNSKKILFSYGIISIGLGMKKNFFILL